MLSVVECTHYLHALHAFTLSSAVECTKQVPALHASTLLSEAHALHASTLLPKKQEKQQLAVFNTYQGSSPRGGGLPRISLSSIAFVHD